MFGYIILGILGFALACVGGVLYVQRGIQKKNQRQREQEETSCPPYSMPFEHPQNGSSDQGALLEHQRFVQQSNQFAMMGMMHHQMMNQPPTSQPPDIQTK